MDFFSSPCSPSPRSASFTSWQDTLLLGSQFRRLFFPFNIDCTGGYAELSEIICYHNPLLQLTKRHNYISNWTSLFCLGLLFCLWPLTEACLIGAENLSSARIVSDITKRQAATAHKTRTTFLEFCNGKKITSLRI